jgi:hypothetical protein
MVNSSFYLSETKKALSRRAEKMVDTGGVNHLL